MFSSRIKFSANKIVVDFFGIYSLFAVNSGVMVNRGFEAIDSAEADSSSRRRTRGEVWPCKIDSGRNVFETFAAEPSLKWYFSSSSVIL